MWLILLLITVQILSKCNSNLLVEVEQGVVLGKYYSVSNGRIINAFLGVPYAAPPVGNNRFKEPQPLSSWTGVFNATTYNSACIQYNHLGYKIFGEEDCLHLNIYTPKLPKYDDFEQSMDVLVYIHGGAFAFGTGNVKRPDYLLTTSDIIFVTINYRLGPMGFLSTGDSVVPGNNGLKDQVAALRWIQRNIAQFGGNASSVTIAGMSAGGASVHYHYLSPLSQGLFHRGISQSGSVLLPWALSKSTPEKSRRLASLLGCPTESSEKMLHCLQSRPARQIVERIKHFTYWRYNPIVSFGPVVESNNENAFLPKEPHVLTVKNLNWLSSTTQHEGLYPVADFISEDVLMELDRRWIELAPHLLLFNDTIPVDKHKEVSSAIRRHYFGNNEISTNTLDNLIRMFSDRLFGGIEHLTKLQASTNTAPVFYYQFRYRGKYSISNVFTKNLDDYGVSHADDTQYVLRVHYSNSNETESDRQMIDLMVSIWVSFIKTGIPTIPDANWPSVPNNMEDFHYIQISSPYEVQISSNRNASNAFQYWNSLLAEFPSKGIRDEL